MRGAFLALAVLLSGCAATRHSRARVVEVEGWAALEAPQARTRALAEALRRAAEEAAGVTVSAVTAVDQSARVRQQVRTASGGRVTRFEALEERVEGGFLKARVRAWVAPAGEADPGQAALPWPSGGPPRLALSLRSRGERAVETVARGLALEGFPPHSAGEPADLLVQGVVETVRIPERRIEPMASCLTRLTVAASDPGSGAVVWAKTLEASALGVDESEAHTHALEAAAAAFAAAAAKELPEALWKRLR